MKSKTSITLSEDPVKAIDRLAGRSKNRSEFIATAVRTYIAQMIRQKGNARDVEIINQLPIVSTTRRSMRRDIRGRCSW